MAIETANVLRAAGTFSLSAAGPQVIVNNQGFSSALPVRDGVGAYHVRLDDVGGGLACEGFPPTVCDWTICANVLYLAGFTGAFSCLCRVRDTDVSPGGDGYIIDIALFNAAGAAADGATVQLMVWQMPANS